LNGMRASIYLTLISSAKCKLGGYESVNSILVDENIKYLE